MYRQFSQGRYLSSSVLTFTYAIILTFALHTLAGNSPCAASEKIDTTDAKKVFEAMWGEREKILQAECVITEYVVNDKNEKHEFQKSRFILNAEIPALKSEAKNLVDPSKSFVWIETPDNAVIYRPASKSMQIRPPEDARLNVRPREFVDPRNLGFSTRVELRRRAYHDFKAAYESLLDGDFTFTVRQDAGNRGRDVLEITSEKFKFQRRIFANPERKFVTEFAELYYLNGDPPPSSPEYTMATQWDLNTGIYLPTECKIVNHSDKVTHLLIVDWKSINKPISKSEFSWQSLEIANDTKVFENNQD